MGKLIEVLGIKEQGNLPQDVLITEALIVGMQEIYSKSPQSVKKQQLANSIAELTRLLMQQLRQVAVVGGSAPEKKNELFPGVIWKNYLEEIGFLVEYTSLSGSGLEKTYSIIWNVPFTILGKEDDYRRTTNDKDPLINEIKEKGDKEEGLNGWHSLKLQSGNWYTGIYTTESGSEIKYLFCYDKIKSFTELGHIVLEASTLFWGSKMEINSILSNNQAIIFSELATEDDIKRYYVNYVKKTLPDLFDGSGIKSGLKLSDKDSIYTTTGKDFFEIEVKGKNVTLILKNSEYNDFIYLFIAEEWADIKIEKTEDSNGNKFEKGAWYYCLYNNAEYLMQFDKISRSDNDTFNYVYYKQRFYADERYNHKSYGYRVSEYLANTELENGFLKVSKENNNIDKAKLLIQKYIENSTNYKRGTIIDNENIGGSGQRRIDSNNIGVEYYEYINKFIGLADGKRVYVSKGEENWAYVIGTQTKPTTGQQTVTRRKSKPQPDTDPTSVTEGTIEVGNDGNRYVARKGGDGRNRWSKIK